MARFFLDAFVLEIPNVKYLDIDIVGSPVAITQEDGSKYAVQTIVQRLVAVNEEDQEVVVENKNRTVPAELAALIIKFLTDTDTEEDRGMITAYAKTFNDRINVIADPSRPIEETQTTNPE